jgi:peptidoglycan/xylan/chitin deacetylase (PgdA/CDA1 family)
LDYLGRHFQVVSLSELVERRENCGGLAAITFDDGYADNLWHALPALQERGMPATVFVTSKYLDSTEGVWWERLARWVVQSGRDTMRVDTGDRVHEFPDRGRPTKQYRIVRKFLTGLTAEERKTALADVPTHPEDRFITTSELSELAAAGVQIEGHTVTHPRLSSLDREQMRREVSDNKNTLEALLNRKVDFMAYPYGDRDDFNAVSMEVARDAGYRAAFAAYRGLVGPETDLFAIPRIATRQEFDRFRVTTARSYPTQ